MIFNSLAFVVFLVVVFAMHWLPLSRSRRHQNVVLLIASYVFYGWWDPRFLTLLLFSSLVDHFIGLKIAATEDERQRRTYLWISMSTNLGLLFFFKYFNFFVGSFKEAFGLSEAASTLDIILPVGISFYTFQTMSYTIDVYRRQMEPSRNIIEFLTFVSFFPQLVAGPIERARTLLPQIAKRRVFSFDQGVSGYRLILLGAFKKIVIADRAAPLVDEIFSGQELFGGWLNLVGILLFSFQLYGDFSGYTDMATGTARLFNIELIRNFNRPYFSRDVGEFWRRWHISLSTWFRDYLYIPLGGSRGSKTMIIRNVLIVFLLSGLWHGANWTFIVWGGLNAILFIPLILARKHKRDQDPFTSPRVGNIIMDVVLVLATFLVVSLTRVYFRAESMAHAHLYFSNMVNGSSSYEDITYIVRSTGISVPMMLSTVLLCCLLISIDLLTMKKWFIKMMMDSAFLRYICYFAIAVIIGMFGVFNDPRSFIYFQF